MFAMQHYGVPTRLLDWSENLLVAAYFSAQHDTERCECATGDCRPTLWILDPVTLNRSNPRFDGMGEAITIFTVSDADKNEIEPWAPGGNEQRSGPAPIAIFGTHNSSRIVAQQGTFTVAGKEDIPLNELNNNYLDDALVKMEFRIPHSELEHQLRLIGVGHSTVQPDLTGIGMDITVEELS